MDLQKFNRRKIRLRNSDDVMYEGIGYYCDKKDYEAPEDGIELFVNKAIWVFYESDIKSIEIID